MYVCLNRHTKTYHIYVYEFDTPFLRQTMVFIVCFSHASFPARNNLQCSQPNCQSSTTLKYIRIVPRRIIHNRHIVIHPNARNRQVRSI